MIQDKNRILIKLFFITICLFGYVQSGHAQKILNNIKGFVYGDNYRNPINDVVVHAQSGAITISQKDGSFLIPVKGIQDSIWFSYNGKNTLKYSIDTIKHPDNFEVRIYLPNYTNTKGYIPTVSVYSRNYQKDSLSLRNDYANIFNRKKPWDAVGDGVAITPTGIGVDLDAVINLFRFGYNKRQYIYQQFALSIEQDRYIDHRFTKEKVEQLTGLQDSSRDDFMKKYRPDYNSLLLMNEIELGRYIQLSFINYQKQILKKEEHQNIFQSSND